MKKILGPWTKVYFNQYEAYVRLDSEEKPFVEYYLTLQNRRGVYAWRFIDYETKKVYEDLHKDSSWNPQTRMRPTQSEVRDIVDQFLVAQGYELISEALWNMR